MKSVYSRSILLVAIGLNALTTLLGDLSYRYLMHDQANYTFFGFHSGSPGRDKTYFRQFHSLLQWPSIVVAHLTSDHFGLTPFLIAQGLTYWLFMALGTAYAYWLCRSYKRTDLFLFVLLSFALASQSTLANVGGLVPDNLILFWPAFLLVFLSPHFGKAELARTALILLAWSFSHESSIIFMGFILSCALLRRAKGVARERLKLHLLLLFCLVAIVWTVYRVFGPEAGSSEFFLKSLQYPQGPFRITCAALLILFAVMVFYSNRRLHIAACLLGIGIAIFCGIQLFLGEVLWIIYDESIGARTTAPLFCVAIGALAILHEQTKRTAIAAQGFTIFVAVTLYLSAFYDGLSDFHWIRARQHLVALMDQSSGCHEYSETDPRWQEVLREGIDWETVGAMSILLAEKKQVSHMLFVRSREVWRPYSYCCALKKGYFYRWRLSPGNFDFQSLPRCTPATDK